MEKPEKRIKAILRELKVWLVVFIVGVVLGAFLYARIYPLVAPQPEQNQPTVQTLSPSVVFSRVQEEGELVSASQDYAIVDKVTDSNRDFLDLFDVPFTQKSFWYRYTGTIKAGVDLSTAEFEQDEADQSLLHVTLDQPYIISNTPEWTRAACSRRTTTSSTPSRWRTPTPFADSASREARRRPLPAGFSTRPRRTPRAS